MLRMLPAALLLLALPAWADPVAFTLQGAPGNAIEIGGIRVYDIQGATTTARDVGETTYLDFAVTPGASHPVGEIRFLEVGAATGHSQRIGPATYLQFEGRPERVPHLGRAHRLPVGGSQRGKDRPLP